MPIQEQVFVLTITHRHGTDTGVYRTREGAYTSLASYCRSWWNEVSTKPVPAQDQDGEEPLIAEYFERQEGNESYELVPVIIHD